MARVLSGFMVKLINNSDKKFYSLVMSLSHSLSV